MNEEKYDKNGNLVYEKYANDYEYWYKWENDKQINITEQEFKQIEIIREKQELYFNNKKINRFSLMDI